MKLCCELFHYIHWKNAKKKLFHDQFIDLYPSMDSFWFNVHTHYYFDQKMFFLLIFCINKSFKLKNTIRKNIYKWIGIFIHNQIMHIQMTLKYRHLLIKQAAIWLLTRVHNECSFNLPIKGMYELYSFLLTLFLSSLITI